MKEENNISMDTLYRSIKAVSTRGYFRETKSNHFKNTPLTDILRQDHLHSIKQLAFVPLELFFTSMDKIYNNIRMNQNSFLETHKIDAYSWIKKNQMTKDFYVAMKEMKILNGPILEDIRMNCSTIVDIGGGSGSFLNGVIEKNPQSKAVLFDKEEVIELAKKRSSFFKNNISIWRFLLFYSKR